MKQNYDYITKADEDTFLVILNYQTKPKSTEQIQNATKQYPYFDQFLDDH